MCKNSSAYFPMDILLMVMNQTPRSVSASEYDPCDSPCFVTLWAGDIWH